MQFLDLSKQYGQLQNQIDSRMRKVFEHGQFIMGPEVAELENNLAKFVGAKHAITCANGTDALTLALMALNIGEGDAVFVPTFTFFASAETIALARATPIFVDIDERTFNISISHLESQINRVRNTTSLTPRAIMSVDLFGLPANYPEIKRLADEYDLLIIEDGAQGFGGGIELCNDLKRACSFGHISTTSFFPAKPLGCYGDGGAVFTDVDEYAELIRSYRVHGKGKNKYDNVRVGLNSRLDTIQAAILLEKLVAFPTELIKRNKTADFYNYELSGHFTTPSVPQGYQSSWAQYTLIASDFDERARIMSKLSEVGVPSMIYYEKCMHQQGVFRQAALELGAFPVAEKIASCAFSIPMDPYMSSGDLDRVTSALIDISIGKI